MNTLHFLFYFFILLFAGELRLDGHAGNLNLPPSPLDVSVGNRCPFAKEESPQFVLFGVFVSDVFPLLWEVSF